jgi:hypothetical protein
VSPSAIAVVAIATFRSATISAAPVAGVAAVAAATELVITNEFVGTGRAEAGTTELIRPKPNAATVTSEIRLKVVFVDIFFLSIVDPRTIRGSA